MPELPDVEVERRYLAATSLHRPIEKVRVSDGRVLKNLTPSGLGRRVHRRSLAHARRHGKWLVVPFEDDAALVLHFGMTGFLKAYRSEAALTPHCQVRFRFADGGSLDYVASRKLGEVRIAASLDDLVERRGLGPDAWSVSLAVFQERLGSRRGTVKGALTHQSVLAGLGNMYADETLFQARIHPRAPAAELPEEKVKRLHGAMRDVLQTAVEAKADPEAMPDAFLLLHRCSGAPCPRCQGRVESYEIGGRRGYYCPRCQT